MLLLPVIDDGQHLQREKKGKILRRNKKKERRDITVLIGKGGPYRDSINLILSLFYFCICARVAGTVDSTLLRSIQLGWHADNTHFFPSDVSLMKKERKKSDHQGTDRLIG